MVVAYEVDVKDVVVVNARMVLGPGHTESTQYAVASKFKFTHRAVQALGHAPRERLEHVRTIPAAARMVLVAPANVVGKQGAKRVEVARGERLTHLVDE